MPPRKQKPVNPLESIRKEQVHTRRAFLAVGATAAGGILSSWLFGKKKTPSKPPAKLVMENGAERKAKPVEKLKPKPKPRPERQVHGFKVYREGLSGESLAKAYKIPFTRRVLDLRKVPEPLVHDLKVMIVQECRKYNQICEINSKGIQMVDPYEVLAVIAHESHFNPNAQGKAGDKGLGQLMPSQIETLRGLKMPTHVNNPFDPLQNIAGVVRTFAWFKNNPPNKQNQTPYRRWAAYNRGRGTAKNLDELRGNQYANKILRLWTRFKEEKALKSYI